ncbi:winged helix-turn-helix domain-containing protein [Leptolyngbya sp. AN03gr2]|uniref:winged helix-turn-helix domain-containing protein n=1 Tax=unclassified Leptolyngbya TaxID=2650499 RepID=UPI003D317560
MQLSTISESSPLLWVYEWEVHDRICALARSQRLLYHQISFPSGHYRKTVDVHVRWLREKLESAPSDPQYLKMLRGFGYRLG